MQIDRPWPDGRTFEEHRCSSAQSLDVLIMADCMTMDDNRRAVAAGCDLFPNPRLLVTRLLLITLDDSDYS